MTNINANKEIIFVFDLHGVLFKLSTIEVIKEAFKIPNKLRLMKIAFYPHVLLKSFISMCKGTVAEKIVLNLDQNFPNLQVKSSGLKILNAQKPIKETIEIAKNLKAMGYKVYILSNIGENSLEILNKKHPDIFKNFDGITGTSAEDDYLQKPDPMAFEKFFKKYKHHKENIIFIDDQMKNIKSATEFGMTSILFKSSSKLKKQLINLKILGSK